MLDVTKRSVEKATNCVEAEGKVELFLSFIVSRAVSAGREFMGLFHDEGTRSWFVSCGPDLIFLSPQDCTRIYLYFTKLYESPRTFMWNGEVANSAASSKHSSGLGRPVLNLSSSDV